MNEQYDYISVGEYAKRKGVSEQTIRNHIAKGMVETIEFKRGRMRGLLCRVSKKNNN